MNKYYLIVLLVIFSACNRQKTVEELIVGEKGYKYWVRVNDNQADSIFYVDYFDRNEKWTVFLIEAGELIKHELPDDVIRTERWRMKSDSTLLVGESSIINILRITKDSLIRYNHSRDKIYIFTTLPDSLIPENYRKFQ